MDIQSFTIITNNSCLRSKTATIYNGISLSFVENLKSSGADMQHTFTFVNGFCMGAPLGSEDRA